MKLFCGLSALAAVLVIACGGASGLDKSGLPLPNPAMAGKAGISLDEMGEGYWVFTRKCMECHEAKLPLGNMEGQWHPVIHQMSGNSGLSTSEERLIQKYVRAASFR